MASSGGMRKRAGLPFRDQLKNADREMQCECGADIRLGDLIRRKRLEDGRVRWVHNDCRGRLETQLRLNPDNGPSEWVTPPKCSECGAYMTRSDFGYRCLLIERHASGAAVMAPR